MMVVGPDPNHSEFSGSLNASLDSTYVASP